MDLQTLQENLIADKYKSKESFKEDVDLIIRNAKLYNQKTTVYFKLANELE